MHDRRLIDLGDSLEDALTKFFCGFHADVTEEGPGHLAKERFGEIQPGPMHGSQDILESIRPSRQVGAVSLER